MVFIEVILKGPTFSVFMFLEVLCVLCHRSSLLPFANCYIVYTSVLLLVVCVHVWTDLNSVISSSLYPNSGRNSVPVGSEMLLYCRCHQWFPLAPVTTFSLLSAEDPVTKPNGVEPWHTCSRLWFVSAFLLMLVYWSFSEILSPHFLLIIFIYVYNERICDQRKKIIYKLVSNDVSRTGL